MEYAVGLHRPNKRYPSMHSVSCKLDITEESIRVPQELALISGNKLRQRGSVAQAGTGDKIFIK
jgi:hypothetical protein